MKTTIINKISESLAMTVVVVGLFCSCEDAYDVTVPEFEVKLQAMLTWFRSFQGKWATTWIITDATDIPA